MPDWVLRWRKTRKIRRGEYRYKKLISEEQLAPCMRRAVDELAALGPLGDYLEFGVCHGTSMGCMHRVMRERGIQGVRMFGFDSFEGLPAAAATDDENTWQPGAFKSELAVTKALMTQQGIDWSRTHLLKGWFEETCVPETIEAHDIQRASIIMVDCDLYSSTTVALNFCMPLIEDRAVIIFDDWNSSGLADRSLGEKRAFDEYLASHPEYSARDFGSYCYGDNPNGQLFLVERERAAA